MGTVINSAQIAAMNLAGQNGATGQGDPKAFNAFTIALGKGMEAAALQDKQLYGAGISKAGSMDFLNMTASRSGWITKLYEAVAGSREDLMATWKGLSNGVNAAAAGAAASAANAAIGDPTALHRGGGGGQNYSGAGDPTPLQHSNPSSSGSSSGSSGSTSSSSGSSGSNRPFSVVGNAVGDMVHMNGVGIVDVPRSRLGGLSPQATPGGGMTAGKSMGGSREV